MLIFNTTSQPIAGTKPAHVLYTHTLEHEAVFRQAARIAHDKNGPLIIDWEQSEPDPRLNTDAGIEQIIDNYKRAIGWAHDECPGLRVSAFRMGILSKGWGQIASDPAAHTAWMRANARLAKHRDERGRFDGDGLLDAQEFLTPSAYTSAKLSREKALGMIDCFYEAARAFNKQCFPFLTHLHNPEKTPDTLLLDKAKACKDGFCIWAHGRHPASPELARQIVSTWEPIVAEIL